MGVDDAGVDAGPDDAIILPDGPLPDIGDPEICKQDQVPFTLQQDPRGNYTLVTPTTVTYHPLTITGAGTKDSAAALNGAGVAALVITRSTTETDPTAALTPIQQRFFGDLTKNAIGTATVRASGTAGKSADGSPEVKEAIWDVIANPATGPGKLRDLLVRSQVADSRNPGRDGSWLAVKHVSGKPGNLYGTAVACFILAIPNRYLPILQEGKIEGLKGKYAGE